MQSLVKDTHNLINFLQTKGYSKEQAEGFVEAVKEFDTAELATKRDLQELRADLYRYIFGIALGQVTITVALIQLLK